MKCAVDALQLVTEPTRREILELLSSGELAAGHIAAQFDTTFGAVSQHLRKLRDAGLVAVRRQGSQRLYSLDHDRLRPYKPLLEAMWSARLSDLAATIESERD